jgi:hypothetical protein
MIRSKELEEAILTKFDYLVIRYRVDNPDKIFGYYYGNYNNPVIGSISRSQYTGLDIGCTYKPSRCSGTGASYGIGYIIQDIIAALDRAVAKDSYNWVKCDLKWYDSINALLAKNDKVTRHRLIKSRG